MNWDQIKGDWHQLSARLKEKWAKLTSEDLATIAGRACSSRSSCRDTMATRNNAQRRKSPSSLTKFPPSISRLANANGNYWSKHNARRKR